MRILNSVKIGELNFWERLKWWFKGELPESCFSVIPDMPISDLVSGLSLKCRVCSIQDISNGIGSPYAAYLKELESAREIENFQYLKLNNLNLELTSLVGLDDSPSTYLNSKTALVFSGPERFKKIPILILEGFTIKESSFEASVDDLALEEKSRFIVDTIYPWKLQQKDSQFILNKRKFIESLDLSSLGIDNLWEYQISTFEELNSDQSGFYRWGRRTGKNLMLLVEVIHRIYSGKAKNVLIISSSKIQSNSLKAMFLDLIGSNKNLMKGSALATGEAKVKFAHTKESIFSFHSDLVVANEPQHLDQGLFDELKIRITQSDTKFLMAGTLENNELDKLGLPSPFTQIDAPTSLRPDWKEIEGSLQEELSSDQFLKETLVSREE